MYPSLFISHGSPSLTLEKNETTAFLRSLAKTFEPPKAIVVVSAHWVTKELHILANNEPSLIYDFYNFPQALYEQEYFAKNDLTRVKQIITKLAEKNIVVHKDEKRAGYDHGVWSPLKLIFPNADIPIIQLSLPFSYSASKLLKLGEALQPLRDEMLILASGGLTHNLGAMKWQEPNAKPVDYAVSFASWVQERLTQGELEQVKDFARCAPNFVKNHPTSEHFLPLFVALGASTSKKGQSLNNIFMYGNLSMDTIIFKE